MKIVIKLGTHEKNRQFDVHAHPNWLVSRLLMEVRLQLRPPLPKNLYLAELSGSTVFLALSPKGPRLEEAKRLSDYQLLENCVLWLMCANLADEISCYSQLKSARTGDV